MRNGIFALILLAGCPAVIHAVGEPVVFYSDLTSGPKTGGKDDKGVWVTINGNNFGAVRGNGYVTVGGGEADNYAVWRDSVIVFQLGSLADTGDIVVHTSSGTSNAGIPFTVRAGNIYFVDDTSPNDPGSGTYADPWRSPRSYFLTMAPGDVCYFMEGTYPGKYGRQTYYHQITIDNSVPGGSLNNEIAWVGYPGQTALFRSQVNYPGSVQIDWGREYYVFSNLSFYSLGSSSAAAARECFRVFTNNNRIVNCRIEGMKNLAYALFGVTATTGTKITGNECFGASSYDKRDHLLYCQSGADNVDFGWNRLHDNNIGVGPVIAINQDSVRPDFRNIVIHDNLFDCRNSSGVGQRCLGIADAGPGTNVTFYNNVVIESNIYVWNLGASLDAYNNTFYRSSGKNTGYVMNIESSGTVRIVNNILHAQSDCRYCYDLHGTATIDHNCYYGGTGDLPADDHPVNADPLFRDSGNYDLHLTSSSPCIDAGTDTIREASRDKDGVSRTTGRVDLGAYEYAAFFPWYDFGGCIRDTTGTGIDGVVVVLASADTTTNDFIGSLQALEPGQMRVLVSSVPVSSLNTSQTASIEFKGYAPGVHRLRVYNSDGVIVGKQDSAIIGEGGFIWSPSGYSPGTYYLLIKGPGMFSYLDILVFT